VNAGAEIVTKATISVLLQLIEVS